MQSNYVILFLNFLKKEFRKQFSPIRWIYRTVWFGFYVPLQLQLQPEVITLVLYSPFISDTWNAFWSGPCINRGRELYSVERTVIFYSVFLCVFSGRGSSMLMKSAMSLDLEFQHGIPFMIWDFPIPQPLFLVIHLPFPLSPKIQLCWIACNSPKLISLCFCTCSYLFLVIVKNQICLHLPGKTLSPEVVLDGFAGLPLSSCSAID